MCSKSQVIIHKISFSVVNMNIKEHTDKNIGTYRKLTITNNFRRINYCVLLLFE